MDLTITTTVQEADRAPAIITKVILAGNIPVTVKSTNTTLVTLSDGSELVEVTKTAVYCEKQ
jgi:hypothetical protein